MPSKSENATPAIRVRELEILAGKPHRERLVAWADQARKVRVTVSFLFPDGVRLVEDLLEHAPVDLTVSTYMGATRTAALKALLQLLEHPKAGGKPLRVRVACGDTDGLHAKIYRYTYQDGSARLVVGSANLSASGLDGCGETSLVVAGPKARIPDFRGSDFPALLDRRWATVKDPSPLADAIEGYQESAFSGGFGERVTSTFASFVEVGDADEDDFTFIAHAASTPDAGLRGARDGSPAGNDQQLIIDPADDDQREWAALASQMVPGEIAFLAWEGRKTLHAYRILSKYRGLGPPFPTERIVLYLREIRGAALRGKHAVLRNRRIPRKEMPPKLLALLSPAGDMAESQA